MNKLISIAKAAKVPGAAPVTLRRWEASGRLIPERTASGQRRCDLAPLRPELHLCAVVARMTIACARVSGHDQKPDLARQMQVLEVVFAICQARDVEVVIINQDEDAGFEEDLAQDVLEMIPVFSARLYGSRSHRNQTLPDGVRRAVKEPQC